MQRADCGRPSTFPEFRIPYHHHFAELLNIIFGKKEMIFKKIFLHSTKAGYGCQLWDSNPQPHP